MKRSDSLEEIYSAMVQREGKTSAIYRLAADSAGEEDAKGLLLRLAERCDSYRDKLKACWAAGSFSNRACKLPDKAFFRTIEAAPGAPGSRVPEILMFAISKEAEDFRICTQGAQESRALAVRKLWLQLAEEERRQRLELESFYDKEVISKIS